MSNNGQAPSGVASNRSVSRAAGILRVLAASAEPITVTEIAKRIDLPRATVFRLLLTLEEEGFVDRQDTLYTLGWELARIAQAVDPAAGLISRVKPLVEEIAERLEETITLSLRRGTYDLELVLQANPRTLGMTMADMHGQKWPLHASSTGKLLLAELNDEQIRIATGNELPPVTNYTITDWETLTRELEQVRQRGWASTVDELEEGMISVAVPIRDKVNQLIASLAYVAPRHRIDSERIEKDKINGLIQGANELRRRVVSLTEN